MKKWQIIYYSEKVMGEILSWSKSIVADYQKIIELIEKFGCHSALKNIKPLKKGLFEIKAKGRDGSGRVFFCYQKHETIVVLHAFIKKTQKTPKKEMRLAIKRLKEVRKNDSRKI